MKPAIPGNCQPIPHRALATHENENNFPLTLSLSRQGRGEGKDARFWYTLSPAKQVQNITYQGICQTPERQPVIFHLPSLLIDNAHRRESRN